MRWVLNFKADGTVTVERSQGADGSDGSQGAGGSDALSLPFTLEIFDFVLPSTSSMSSLYSMSGNSIMAGHNATHAPFDQALFDRYLDAGLAHRISGGNALFDALPVAHKRFEQLDGTGHNDVSVSDPARYLRIAAALRCERVVVWST